MNIATQTDLSLFETSKTERQEFAEKWKQFPSPMLMANEIKMSPRSVQNRRRSVEVRLGIKLETENSVPCCTFF